MKQKARLVAGLLACALTGCGGGGGGSKSKIDFSLSPATLSGQQYENDSQQYRVLAQVTRVSDSLDSDVIYVRIVDRDGVITPEVEFQAQSDTSYSLRLRTSAALSAGNHVGSLAVQVCGDPNCVEKYGEQTLGYSVQVLSHTNLKALAPLAGTTDWSNRGGNAAHTGHVPVTLDPGVFSARWRSTVPVEDFMSSVSAVTSGGHLMLSSNPLGSTGTLIALRQSDGGQSWTFEGPADTVDIGPAATNDGHVYVATAQSGEQSSLWALDGQTGVPRLQITYPEGGRGSARAPTEPPVVAAGTIRAITFKTQGVCCGSDTANFLGSGAYDAASGAEKWFTTRHANLPATDGVRDYVYEHSMSPTGLERRTLETGEELGVIDDPALNPYNSYQKAPPVLLQETQTVLVNANDHIVSFDVMGGATRWSRSLVADSVTGLPPAANGVVYLQYRSGSDRRIRILAVDATTGAELWAWTPPGGDATSFPFSGLTEREFIGDPLVTNNLLFVSTNLRVYAVDLATRAMVWCYPHPGLLSISPEGLLLIRRSRINTTFPSGDGYVAAINLQ